ncbi:hypothetical protein [Dietzia sp. 179-F 9C3 NHS]|uniref:hypothetical protein n=1 Tax=Dietzia sp. 179-F 9C3 NHS TaxID=3374295 RepID=UPI0038794654
MLDQSTHDAQPHVPLLHFSTAVELLNAEEVGRRLRTHEPYLEPGQITVLRGVFGRPLVHRDAEHLIDAVLEYPERHEPLPLWERR